MVGIFGFALTVIGVGFAVASSLLARDVKQWRQLDAETERALTRSQQANK